MYVRTPITRYIIKTLITRYILTLITRYIKSPTLPKTLGKRCWCPGGQCHGTDKRWTRQIAPLLTASAAGDIFDPAQRRSEWLTTHATSCGRECFCNPSSPSVQTCTRDKNKLRKGQEQVKKGSELREEQVKRVGSEKEQVKRGGEWRSRGESRERFKSRERGESGEYITNNCIPGKSVSRNSPLVDEVHALHHTNDELEKWTRVGKTEEG